MRLKGEGPPYPANCTLAQTRAPGHGACTPVGSIARCRLQRQSHNPFHLGIGDLAWATRPRLVQQSVQALVEEPTTPFPYSVAREPHLGTHLLVGSALGASQHQPGTLGQGLSRVPTRDPSLQRFSLLLLDLQQWQRSTSWHEHLLSWESNTCL